MIYAITKLAPYFEIWEKGRLYVKYFVPLLSMNNKRYIDTEIDKLTNSIENRITGDVFDTNVIQVVKNNKRQIKKADWRFNWHSELLNENRQVYKLVINNNPFVIQGLLSLEVNVDHVYMHLIESVFFNRGENKMYFGVPGNLVAFACKTSFDYGFDGYVAFDAKSALIRHYQEHCMQVISKELECI